MPGLQPNLSAAERVISAIDTSDEGRAAELAEVAREAGARLIKVGLEYATKTSWGEASALAGEHGLDWVADAKLHDIPNTVAGAVHNLAELDNPPVGITIHTKTGLESLRAAQQIAKEAGIMLLGVTHLTSIGEDETKEFEKTLPRIVVWRESRRAVKAEIGGLVCAAPEIGMVKRFKKTKGLFTMIPGTRSIGASKDDQKRSMTPGEAMERGADILVIGRQISNADDPAEAYAAVVEEIEQGLQRRAA